MPGKYDHPYPAEIRSTEWQRQAACKDHPDPDLWFPAIGDSGYAAKKICADCPVREECADYGRGENYGIWGGMGIRANRADRPPNRGGIPRAVSGLICGYGHVMTAENTIIMDSGKRICRECRRVSVSFKGMVRG